MNNLHAVLNHPSRAVQYDGSVTPTATVSVDNVNRVISVDVSDSITQSINSNSNLISKISTKLDTKVDTQYVDNSISDLKKSVDAKDAELEDTIIESKQAIEELIRQLVPLELRSLEVEYPQVELGTYFKELLVKWTTSRAIDTAALNIDGTEYCISLKESTSNTDYSALIKSDFDSLCETFELDFGDLPQGVTDTFYKMFTAVATRILEPKLTIETDVDGNAVYRITAPYDYITNSNGIITIKGDMDI